MNTAAPASVNDRSLGLSSGKHERSRPWGSRSRSARGRTSSPPRATYTTKGSDGNPLRRLARPPASHGPSRGQLRRDALHSADASLSRPPRSAARAATRQPDRTQRPVPLWERAQIQAVLSGEATMTLLPLPPAGVGGRNHLAALTSHAFPKGAWGSLGDLRKFSAFHLLHQLGEVFGERTPNKIGQILGNRLAARTGHHLGHTENLRVDSHGPIVPLLSLGSPFGSRHLRKPLGHSNLPPSPEITIATRT